MTTLRGLLTDLGLRRRVREAPDLAGYLASRYAGDGHGKPEAASPEAEAPGGNDSEGRGGDEGHDSHDA